MKTLKFRSSYGYIIVDENGIALPEKSDCDDYLLDIIKVNLDEMWKFEGIIGNEPFTFEDYDILNVGYWTKDGKYEEPEHSWRKSVKVMQKISVVGDGQNVVVTCPHCNHSEEHPVDEQRHHLQTFDVNHWGDVDGIELSFMSCHECSGDFRLLWNYDNKEEIVEQ